MRLIIALALVVAVAGILLALTLTDQGEATEPPGISTVSDNPPFIICEPPYVGECVIPGDG